MPSPPPSSKSSARRTTRRELLQAGVAAVAPLIVSARVFGSADAPAANDRVHVGVIGAGIRGRHLIGDMPGDGRVVALCDCFLPRVQRTLKPDAEGPDAAVLARFLEHDAADCAAYADYPAMIDEAKLDAILIAAPDHHHVQAAMLACQAGLDVYCEKPLSLTIREGRRLVEAVRRYDRVLQVGSQQQSMEMDKFACQFVRDGGLGKVSHVEVQNWPGPLRYEGLPEEPVPQGMHWDLFCAATPTRSRETSPTRRWCWWRTAGPR